MTIVTKVWDYSGARVNFTVPSNVTSIRFECWGAPGGDGGGPYGNTNYYLGGLPGYVAGTLAVTPGDLYYFYVGGPGEAGDVYTYYNASGHTGTNRGGPGGWNGGAAGGSMAVGTSGFGGNVESYIGAGAGGGGATDIRYGGTALANRIMVAGGGGGGANYLDIYMASSSTLNPYWKQADNPSSPIPPYGDGSAYQTGGFGMAGYGGPSSAGPGGDATAANGGIASNTAGRGGTQTQGGAGGVYTGSYGASGAAGTSGAGGKGGSVTTTMSNNNVNMGGGGGGGGYYGGGGGATGWSTDASSNYETNSAGGGGGGGSNYTAAGVFTSAVSEGHTYSPSNPIPGGPGDNSTGGMIRVTYIQIPNAPTISLPANYSSFAVDEPLVVDFTFSSPDPTAYFVSFDIQYKTSGGSTWTLHHVVSNSGVYEFDANTFTAGTTYNIQVRTYDSNGDASPWSQITVTAVEVPVSPVVTQPTSGHQFTTPTVTFTWTNPSGSPELQYEITLANTESRSTIASSNVLNTGNRMNFATNPNFESGVTGWTVVGGTIAQSTTYKKLGSDSGKVTWGASSAAYAYTGIVTEPGLEYMVDLWVAPGTYTTDPLITLSAQNPTDTLPFATGDSVSAWTANGTFVHLTLSFVAEESVTWIVLTPGTGVTTSGQVTYIDMVLAELNAGSTPLTYFDGSNLNGNTGTVAWTGTAGASISTLTGSDVLTYTFNWSALNLQSQDVTAYVAYSNFSSEGVMSNPAIVDFSVNIGPPTTPTATLTSDSDTGSITLDISCPTTPTPTVTVDIFRTDLTNGTPEIRLATNLSPDSSGDLSWTDYTPATRVSYQYRVRAYSATRGYADIT